MDLRWVGSVALLAVIAISALFLFPVAHGSYSATHGPGTDLRWKQFRSVLMFVIAAAGFALARTLAPLTTLSFMGTAAVPAALCPALPSFSPLRR
ncbi:MAG: hypothetical protein ACRD3E_15425 [Terriglobales bacterium]